MKTTRPQQAWLYQMNAAKWSRKEFQDEVCEGATLTWPTNKITKPAGEILKANDHVFFFFTRSSTKCSGLHGWAKVTHVDLVENEFCFEALYPTDRLKDKPIKQDKIRQLEDRVRLGCPMGTMWPIKTEDFNLLKAEIRNFEPIPPAGSSKR